MQKNQFIPSFHSSDTVNFRVLSSDWPHAFLTMLTSKIFNHLLICVNLYQHGKNQFIPSVHSRDTVNFRVQRQVTPIFDYAQPKIFHQLLIFVNLYQHIKNEAVSLICSGEIVDLKTLQSDWLRAFWPISQEQDFFPNIRLVQDTTNNTNFHYRTTSVKIQNQIFL